MGNEKERILKRIERIEKCKAECLEMCDNKPSYMEKQILDNMDNHMSELKSEIERIEGCDE